MTQARLLLVAAATALALLTLAPAAGAQVRYKDAEGVTHWVDSIDRVPPEFRSDTPAARSPAPAPPKEADRRAEHEHAKPVQVPRLDLAAPRSPFNYGALQLVVDSCTAKMRRAFTQKDRVGRATAESRFNAFISGPSYVSVDGTTQERVAFQQCLADEGVATVGQ